MNWARRTRPRRHRYATYYSSPNLNLVVTSLPSASAVLALGFYGIWEVGKTMMDPFDWNSPCVDLTAIGRRVADEGGRIARAAREEAEKNTRQNRSARA